MKNLRRHERKLSLLFIALTFSLTGVSLSSCNKEKVSPSKISAQNSSLSANNHAIADFLQRVRTQIRNFKDSPEKSNNPDNKNNPYNSYGQLYESSLNYIYNYTRSILDTTVYDSVKYANSGVKDYSTESKLLDREALFFSTHTTTNVYADSIQKVLDAVQTYSSDSAGIAAYESMGYISSSAVACLNAYVSDIGGCTTNDQVIGLTNIYINNIASSSGLYTREDEQLLLAAMACNSHWADFEITTGGLTTLPDGGPLPGWACWVHYALLGGEYVGVLTAETGLGAAFALGCFIADSAMSASEGCGG